MVRIAFNLGRTAHMALDENAAAEAAERHRRREEQRLAGNDLLRLVDVRNDLLVGRRRRRAQAAAQSRQRQRRAHQF